MKATPIFFFATAATEIFFAIMSFIDGDRLTGLQYIQIALLLLIMARQEVRK